MFQCRFQNCTLESPAIVLEMASLYSFEVHLFISVLLEREYWLLSCESLLKKIETESCSSVLCYLSA